MDRILVFLLVITSVFPLTPYAQEEGGESVIEEVDAEGLADLLEEQSYVAVFFYGRLCGPDCDIILQELENIDDDTDKFGVAFVKCQDRKLAKSYGVKKFPALVYFRYKDPSIYDDDLKNEDRVLEWLTSLESMESPDAIEEVNAVILTRVMEENDFVAALFYKDHCRKCDKALKELENIDDEADNLGIAFVKLRDESLIIEYGFEDLPQLVYYRKKIPLLFEGDLTNEDAVLAWLIEHKLTGEDEDVIEEVSREQLEDLVKQLDQLAVLFYDNDSKKSRKVLRELERIDDDTDKYKIQLVKIDDDTVAKDYGIDDIPTLVYFEKRIPSIYDGDLLKEEEVLNWLIEQLTSDEIEDITDEMLDKLIKDASHLAVLFYDKDDELSQKALAELENIDDECDRHGVSFVKIDNDAEAKEYGIDEIPALVYFEKQIPSVYDGDLTSEEDVLKWLVKQVESDEIEDVTDKMLHKLVTKSKHLAVLFYEKDDKKSDKVLSELENIDDDLDKLGVTFVKIDDKDVSKEFGIDNIPGIVYFENEIPSLYEGDLMKEEELLEWLNHQVHSDEIEDINDEILAKLIKKTPSLVVLFYDKDSPKSEQILKELENIDDDADKHDISVVKIDDDNLAKEYGIESLPALVYFENKIPSFYEGDLSIEEEVLQWLIRQKHEDTIEEINDEVLDDLIRENEYVAVYFTGPDCTDCDKVLQELENIDDDIDSHGMQFVTTEETDLAKKYGIKTFPSFALFKNGEPLLYKGDLQNEEALLSWLIDDETLEIADQIEEVNAKMLEKIINTSERVAVFFYGENCKQCDKILAELEHIDDEADSHNVDFVKISDQGIAKEYGLLSLPALVYYRKRFPQIYEGDLEDEEKILEWLVANKDMPADVIEIADKRMIEMLMDDVENLAVYFYEEDCDDCDSVLQELEKIDDETDKYGIHFVKTNDVAYAEELGITTFPSLVYFEEKMPSIYEGDLTNEEEVLEWLVEQKMEETIENINRDMLTNLIETVDYLAVYFYKEGDPDSEYVLKILELIDDDCSEYGIKLVRMNDHLMAKKYGIRSPPGIVFFRRGKHIHYQGDLEDEDDILDWLTDPGNMELNDSIEKVNRKMLEKIRKRTDYLSVLFYTDISCKQCEKVLQEIENIDDEAHAAGIDFVKIDDHQLAKHYGVYSIPAVVFFKSKSDEPIIYAGDLKNEERILEWLLTNKDPTGEFIEELDGEQVASLVRRADHIAVFFYNKDDCDICPKVLEELEDIDDDTDRHGISFVKTQDIEFAGEFGVHDFPALIFFERHVPNVYEGDLLAEEEVLQWLVTNKNEDTIEAVNREMLEKMVEDTQYLAVYFYKPNCKACDQSLQELENIDDDLDTYGINMVKIHDPVLAKRYGIKTVPAVIYFRNGNPLIYEGDLKNEEMLLEWLTDDDNRELADEIEAVNNRMLDRLLEESPFLAVFFYDESECHECAAVLAELENIDDQADQFGIDFVKINSPDAAERFNIFQTPALVYFRKKVPLIYEGDLFDEEKILGWLTCNDVFELRDEIEEVNRKMLDKLLEENDFVAVYFYDFNCPKCDEILEELEHIDDEADNLDIIFVKIRDPRYSKKYGITSLPSLVYFRKKFPSIYRGDLMAEDEVLEWMQKNRYRHPELNIFMYALAAVALAFILYTVFLIFCFKTHQKTA